jgi:hypothetical protein
MAKLRLARDVFIRAKERSSLSAAEKEAVERLLGRGGNGAVTANASDCPTAFLKALLDDSRLSPNQRAAVALQVHGMAGGKIDRDPVYRTPVANPVAFGSIFMTLGVKSPNCELCINGRWHPVTMRVQFFDDPGENDRDKGVVLHGVLSLCERTFGVVRYVPRDLFLDDSAQPQERTVLEVLNHLGLRGLQTTPAEFNLKLLRAERAAREPGRVVTVSGPVIVDGDGWWRPFESRPLGLPGLPRKAIVEPELEVSEEHRSYLAPSGQDRQAVTRLPFARVFSLDTKSYGYADVDDLAPYAFDAEALAKLHLPEDMRSLLTRVFDTPVEGLFGDVLKGKHGGVVVLACGNPGVGKTLTAEAYAEHTQRPLYVLELGELGTSVGQVEENLQRVFARVAHWNAVLVFDECDIFLTERGADLERSAIVGSFLRLLDYYRGVLFLTTNRAEVLDRAVLSRVMLTLHYPDLDRAARSAVWRAMLGAAGLTLTAGTAEDLAEAAVNGRQIRNLTRLARILYPAGQVTLEQMRAVLRHGCPSEPPAGGVTAGATGKQPASLSSLST